jgi:hypothetical protein
VKILKNKISKMDIIVGWFIVTSTYIVTLALAHLLYRVIFQTPAGLDWATSGTFIGFFMLTIPYIVAGFFVRKSAHQKIKTAIWVSVIPFISEKLLLLWIGSLFVRSKNSSIGAMTNFEFLRGDGGLPYFTVSYMVLGVFSILLCIFVATNTKRAFV